MNQIQNKQISIIIPTYNRFSYLLRAIKSIQEQTFIQNGGEVEIVVVNDKSNQSEYYTSSISSISSSKGCDIRLIHLEQNSKEQLGYACAGLVRNIGVKESSYDMIAFLDDDDWMIPTKLEVQYDQMMKRNSEFSCTDGYAYDAKQVYSSRCQKEEQFWKGDKRFILYNKGLHWEYLKAKLNLDTSFPSSWNYDFLKQHNTVITSSVMMKKEAWNHIQGMKCLRNGQEDYDCWLRYLEEPNKKIDYIDQPLFIYDLNHGDGSYY